MQDRLDTEIWAYHFGQSIDLKSVMDPNILQACIHSAFNENAESDKVAGTKKIGLVCYENAFQSLAQLHNQQIDNLQFNFVHVDHLERSYQFAIESHQFFKQDYDLLIALCDTQQVNRLPRYIRISQKSPCPIMVFLHDGQGSDISLSKQHSNLGPRKPIVYITLPFAGSLRVKNVIPSLLDYFSYTRGHFVLPCYHDRFADIANTLAKQNAAQSKEQLQPLALNYYDSAVKLLNYGQYIDIHSPLFPQLFRDNGDVNFIQLIRDPRDMLNSAWHYHKTHGEIPYGCTDDDYLMEFINKGFVIQPGISVTIEQMVNDLIAITRMDNVYTLRFEDVRYQPHETYRAMLKWLGMDNLFILLTDKSLEKAWHAGTFAGMSNGQAQEGQDTVFTGTISYMRKGEAGDYKNHFSAKIIDELKQRIGPGLVELGYEKNLDW